MADFRFAPGDYVNIDGQGKAKVNERVYRGFGNFYMVRLCDSDCEFEIESTRLLPFIETPATQQTNRFNQVTQADDIDNFINEQSNKSTLSKTVYDLKIIREFFNSSEINESRELHNIPVADLQTLMCRFFMSVKKTNSDEYEPNTLRCFMASFDRQLRRYNYGEYLATSPHFAKVREVLKCKQKQLKRDGKGNLSNRAEPVSDQEIETLWETGQFGSSYPDAILQTLWFYNTVHFGLRRRTEHREMCWGDIKLKTAANGHEYLECNERQTKTRTGVNPRDVRQVTPKLWANLDNPARDPISIYKKYEVKRPAGYSQAEHPFYIATTTKNLPAENDIWFKRNPVGINKLASMMSRMVKAAGISTEKKLSNNSARKYLVQKLSENNVPPNQIMQISGHKNVASINNYSHINEQQHRNISSILQATDENQTVTTNNVSALSSNSSIRAHSSVHVHGGFSSIFASQIHGGKLEIHVHQHNSSPVQPARKGSVSWTLTATHSD